MKYHGAFSCILSLQEKNPTNRALVRKNAYNCGCIEAFTVQVVKSPIKSRGRRLMLIFVLKSFDAARCRYDSKQAWEFVSSVHSVKGVWRCLLLDGFEGQGSRFFDYKNCD